MHLRRFLLATTCSIFSLGDALRFLGTIQLFLGESEGAEADISLMRGARLCRGPPEEAMGLSLLGVQCFTQGKDGERDAFDYWAAALDAVPLDGPSVEIKDKDKVI